MITDLEKDPFISTALSSCLCKVYNYGKYLAPVTACLISAKHFKIKNSCLNNKYDGPDQQQQPETPQKRPEAELKEVTKTPSVATRENKSKTSRCGKKKKRRKKVSMKKKVDVAPAVNSTSASSSTEEAKEQARLPPSLYKGLGLVAIGVFTYIVYKKLATPRPTRVSSPSRAPPSPEKKHLTEDDTFRMD